jgi:phage-related protein
LSRKGSIILSEFKFSVKFFENNKGEEPIRSYIKELKENAKTSKEERIKFKKVLICINALRTWGTRAGLPYVKHIEDEIWELRPLRDRIFFFFWKNDTFVLLHHFVCKKTQKTPKKEIKQAKNNMIEFLERSDKNGK